MSMTTHLSARLTWHDSGWNGRLCQNPTQNTYCVAKEEIREAKDDEFEQQHADDQVIDIPLDSLPPCAREIGTFSPEPTHVLHHDPLESRGLDTTAEGLPPYSFCTTPFEEMFSSDPDRTWVKPERVEEQKDRLETFFDEFKEEASLVFFYAKDGHPLYDDGRRVLVGVSRITEVADLRTFRNADPPIWPRRITHGYPTEGVRLPYQEYLDRGHDLENIRCEIPSEATDSFSYVAHHVTDDIAVGILEYLLEALQGVHRDGYIDGDWEAKIDWVERILDETWEKRGLHPGLGSVLEQLEFGNGRLYQRRVLSRLTANDENPLEHVEEVLIDEVSLREPDLFPEHEILAARSKWRSLSDDRRALLRTLSGFDLQPSQVTRVMAAMGSEDHDITASIEDLQANLYLLAEQDRGGPDSEPISFGTIDRGLFQTQLEGMPPGFMRQQIAHSDDKRRVRALLRNVIEGALDAGDTVLAISEAATRAERHLAEERQCSPNIRAILNEVDFYREALVVDEDTEPVSVALPRAREREEVIASSVRSLAGQTVDSYDVDWGDLLETTLDEIDAPTLDPAIEQAARAEKTDALNTLASGRFSVLKGSAGTGKTTVVRTLLDGIRVGEGRRRALLLALTGKARVQLERTTGGECQTIHQFLMQHDWIEGETYRLRDEGGEKVGAHTVIVDEASMVPSDIMATLFRALDLEQVKRLILIGDPNQLPPIGPGRPFFDVIRWLEDEYPEHITELSQQVRYTASDGQARQLAEVYAGERDEVDDEILSRIARKDLSGDLNVLYWDDYDELNAALDKALQEILEGQAPSDEKTAFDRSFGYNGGPNNAESWQILTPTRINPYGTQAINRRLQHRYRQEQVQSSDTPAFGDERLVKGDKVIQTKNEYRWTPNDTDDVYVANGEIGIITETKSKRYKADNMQVQFTTQEQDLYYWGNDVRDGKLELAYGLTVHKAQGSEFDQVILALPHDAPTLSRELLYTALTRYKENLTLLIEADISKLVELRKPLHSEIRRRSTNLLEPSIRGDEQHFPENLIHRTRRGELVRSKSEVIVANMLDSLDLSYEYEKQLAAPDDESDYRLPDFTVYHQGEEYYWEHLGLLNDPTYQQDWERKKEWYEETGYAERLIVSQDDLEGAIDAQEIEELARTHIYNDDN